MGTCAHQNLKDPTISKIFKCAFQIHINIPQCTLREIFVLFFRNSSLTSFSRIRGAEMGRTHVCYKKMNVDPTILQFRCSIPLHVENNYILIYIYIYIYSKASVLLWVRSPSVILTQKNISNDFQILIYHSH
jgi:hypothetical protein